ncbi:MAG: hypothetical protein L0211_08870, partial [Planctomycetaceae bacterium]|nr:hypothetical protein [Planctomycetaceae bacterium]
NKAGNPYPLLIVRPDGHAAYGAAREALETWGADFGYELIEQDWKLAYPQAEPQLASRQQEAIVLARQQMEKLANSPSRKRRSSASYKISQSGTLERVGGGNGLADGGLAARRRVDTGNGSPGLGGGNETAAAGDPSGSFFARGGGRPSSNPLGSMFADGSGATGSGATGSASASRSGATGSASASRRPSGAAASASASHEPGSDGPGLDTEASGATRSASASVASRASDAAGSAPGSPLSDAGSVRHGTGGPSPYPSGSGSSSGMASPSGGGAPIGSAGMTMPSESADPHADSAELNHGASDCSCIADRQGANWALPSKPGRLSPLRRNVRLAVDRDVITVFADPRGFQTLKVIRLGPDTSDAVGELQRSVWEIMKDWGAAPIGFHWRPTLLAVVTQRGAPRYRDLSVLLRDSGFEISPVR